MNELKRAQEGLRDRVARWTLTAPKLESAVPGLNLFRETTLSEPHRYTREAALCVIAQGAKRVVLGSDVYIYDSHHALTVAMDVPVTAQIVEASVEKPYLSLTVKLDPRVLAEMIVGSDLPPIRPPASPKSLMVTEHTLPLVSAVNRLIDLLDEPESIAVLAPLIQKEIYYRLLTGPMGPHLRQIASAGTPSAQVGRAIDWLKRNFSQAVRVEELAAYSQMSPTAFHHHFRQFTAMSPLQYQKWLRLQEARRLMLTDHFDAARAAYQVGYESPSQFSREYRRLFDAPPAQDIKTLRQAPISYPA